MCDVDKLSKNGINQTEGCFLWRAPLTSLPYVAVPALLQERGFRAGESLGRAWGGGEFYPTIWNSESCLGTTEHMLEEGTNGKHLEVTLTGRVCALPPQKPQSLSIERQREHTGLVASSNIGVFVFGARGT